MYNIENEINSTRLEIALECDKIINQIDIDCEVYILSKSSGSSTNDIQEINRIRTGFIKKVKEIQTANLDSPNQAVRNWCYYIKSGNLRNYPQFEFGLLLITDFLMDDEQIENLK